jgi:nucleotide-binding universal stress UspA family protein
MTAMQTVGEEEEYAPMAVGGRVIVGVDDSPGGLAALRWAVELARSANEPLVAVRVWALGLPRHGGLRRHGDGRGNVVLAFAGAQPRQAAAQLVRQAFRTAVGGIPGDLDVTIEVPEGSPGPVLTQLASATGDVLVVGTTPGHGLKRALHGSVSNYCASQLPGQVEVIVAGSPGRARAGHSRTEPAPADTGENRPGPFTRAVRW